jgi:hypothetical protein
MKIWLIGGTLALLLVAGTASAQTGVYMSGGVNVFYSSLASHGQWVESSFGVAWRPMHVGPRWRPYLYGRWAWTRYGWYWVSYEPFGWATFHYGRWYFDDYYGWIWIPGNTWGPSWVEWRYSDDYIGWAPLPPYATFSVNFGITYSSTWHAPVHYWNFVPCRSFTATRIVAYVQPIEHTRRIFGNTRQSVDIRTEDDRIMNRGIDVGFVERRANVRINSVDVVQSDRRDGDRISKRSGREVIEVYRPRIEEQSRGRVRTDERGTVEQQRSGERREAVDNRRGRVNPQSQDNQRTREQSRGDVGVRRSRPQMEQQRQEERRARENQSLEQREQRKGNSEQYQVQRERRMNRESNRGAETRGQEQPRGRQQSSERSRGDRR